MKEREFSLTARVRRAELNFEALVELLETRGYVTSLDAMEGVYMGRVQIEQSTQEDFDALFALLMPGRVNDVKLLSTATDKGAAPGLFTSVLFNTKVIDYEEMSAQLIEINRGEL